MQQRKMHKVLLIGKKKGKMEFWEKAVILLVGAKGSSVSLCNIPGQAVMSSLACHSVNYTQVRFPTTNSTSIIGLGYVKMSGLVLPHGTPWRLFQKIIFIKRGACCDVAVLGSVFVMFPLPFCSFLSVYHKPVCGKGWFQNSYLKHQQGFVLQRRSVNSFYISFCWEQHFSPMVF